MKLLLHVNTLSDAQAIRLQLEAAGIKSLILGESLAGALGGGYPVYLTDDAEEARARLVLAQQRTDQSDQP